MIARSAVMNGVEGNLLLFQNGLSDQRAQRFIEVSRKNKGGSSLTEMLRNASNVVNVRPTFRSLLLIRTHDLIQRVPVDLIFMDDLVPELLSLGELEVAFLKVDIEGFESRFLHGGSNFWSTFLPTSIQAELQGWSFARTKVSHISLDVRIQ